MKFGQLIEWETYFLKNHRQNVMEKLVPDLFWKIIINRISESIGQSFMQFVFIVCQVEGYRNKLKISCKPLAFTSYQASFNNKKRSGTSLSYLIFCITFEKKCLSCYFLLIDQVSLSGCLYFAKYWATYEL